MHIALGVATLRRHVEKSGDKLGCRHYIAGAIVDDSLKHPTMRSHLAKLEDILISPVFVHLSGPPVNRKSIILLLLSRRRKVATPISRSIMAVSAVQRRWIRQRAATISLTKSFSAGEAG